MPPTAAVTPDSAAARPASAFLDEAGLVAVDLPCVSCQYNLRTCAAAGVCPECGQPVQPSLHAQPLPLSYTSRHWLRLMWVGAAVAAAMLALGLLPVICYWLGVALTQLSMGFTGGRAQLLAWSRLYIWLLSIATMFPLAVAVFLLTRRERAGVRGRMVNLTRPVARWLWLAAIAIGAWWIGTVLRWNAEGWPGGADFRSAVAMRQVGGLLGCLSSFALGLYIFGLLRRTDRPISLWLVMLPGVLILSNELLDVVARRLSQPLLAQLPFAATGRVVLIAVLVIFAMRVRQAAVASDARQHQAIEPDDGTQIRDG